MAQTQISFRSIAHALSANQSLKKQSLHALEAVTPWIDLLAGSVLKRRKLSEQSVLIAVTHQLTTATLLTELDGIARRIVLYPPDQSLEHLDYVARTAEVDVIVSDRDLCGIQELSPELLIPSKYLQPVSPSIPSPKCGTEWILLTSGTTGPPKLVVHTFSSLAEAATNDPQAESDMVWATFYDIRRYGGLQIFLRAVLAGCSLVLSAAGEAVSDFLMRARAAGVTHISGTPTHWRRAAINAADLIEPRYVRLSGEVADQALLNHLTVLYPGAAIAHAFATTEAGVVFTVNDGHMGLPLNCLGKGNRVETKIEDGTLRVRSDRTAMCYLGSGVAPLKTIDGFVDTGDVLEQRDKRLFFAGRGDGVINVGGQKVHPEEVETVINGHPKVRMSLVRKKKSPIVGSIVVADVVLKVATQPAQAELTSLTRDILSFCHDMLDKYKVPATINFVTDLPVAESGKLIRRPC